jgi:hypothetical protein
MAAKARVKGSVLIVTLEGTPPLMVYAFHVQRECFRKQQISPPATVAQMASFKVNEGKFFAGVAHKTAPRCRFPLPVLVTATACRASS